MSTTHDDGGTRLAGALRLLVTLVTTLFASLLLVGTTTAAAHAHAELVGSSPAPGTNRPVDEVRLQFGEPLADGLSQVAVTGPTGSVTDGKAVVTGNEVVVPLKPLTRSGTYSVAYRVVAADGHAEVGGLDVVVTPRSAAAATKRAAHTTSPSTGPEGAGSAARGTRSEAPEQPLPVGSGASDTSGASSASGGLDLGIAGGGLAALVLLLGLHLLLRRGATPAGRTS